MVVQRPLTVSAVPSTDVPLQKRKGVENALLIKTTPEKRPEKLTKVRPGQDSCAHILSYPEPLPLLHNIQSSTILVSCAGAQTVKRMGAISMFIVAAQIKHPQRESLHFAAAVSLI